jgi:hypothetical protein
MLSKKLLEGIIGRISWYYLDGNYGAERYVFFPENDIEYNKWGILMLSTYIKINRLHNVVVLVTNRNIRDAILLCEVLSVNIKMITEKKMRQYMSYYALIDKSDKWTVISVENPYKTGVERMIGIKGVTNKDIVYYDIFKLSHEKIETIDKSVEEKIESCLSTGKER